MSSILAFSALSVVLVIRARRCPFPAGRTAGGARTGKA